MTKGTPPVLCLRAAARTGRLVLGLGLVATTLVAGPPTASAATTSLTSPLPVTATTISRGTVNPITPTGPVAPVQLPTNPVNPSGAPGNPAGVVTPIMPTPFPHPPVPFAAVSDGTLIFMPCSSSCSALDTDFYRHSPQSANAAEPTRVLIPLVVSRHQRYFVDRLQTRTDDSYGTRYYWHYMDDVPAGINTHTEDTSHGQVDMQYLDVLRRNYDRLNALASARGEPIPLDTTQVRLFANTFLERVAGSLFHKTGIFLASDIDGTPVDSPANADYYAKLCDGWLNLAAADPNVYTICREISLRIVNGWQPHVGIGNHSALLMNKAYSQ